MTDLRHIGNGDYDLDLGDGWVAEFTRDSHGFKFWALRHGDYRLEGDRGEGERVPVDVARWLRDHIENGGDDGRTE